MESQGVFIEVLEKLSHNFPLFVKKCYWLPLEPPHYISSNERSQHTFLYLRSVKIHLTWSSGIFISLFVILLMHVLEGQEQIQE